MNKDQGKKKRAGIYFFSVTVHVILLVMLSLPFLKTEKQDDVLYNGVVVNFSHQQTRSSRPATKSIKRNNPIKKAAETKPAQPTLTTKSKTKVAKQPQKKVKAQTSKPKILDENTLIEKRQKYLKESLENQRQQKLKAEEDARQKAAQAEKAKKEKFQSMKNAFSHILKNAKDETPTSSDFDLSDKSMAAEAIAAENNSKSNASGKHLGNRKVIYVPEIKDNSQKQGRVVINICVNSTGKVISARYTQKGSTTTDKYLVDLAIKNAKLYRFSQSQATKQCGIVNIDFELR